MKFFTCTNSNMQNAMMVCTLSAFDGKNHYLANLVQVIKIGCLSWNLVCRLIWLCRMNCWCSLFLFLNGNTLSGKIYSQKFRIVCLKLYLVPRLIRICRVQWWCSLFLFSTGDILFRQISPKTQNCQFKLKFVI